MAPAAHGLAIRQLLPATIKPPPGADPMAFYLSLPALGPDQVPRGADTTMTTDDPEQIWYLVTAITCIGIPGLFMMLRIYTKMWIVKSFDITDYFIFLAYPLMIVEVAMGYHMVKWGAGVHQWQVTLDQLFHQLYWANIGQIVYCPLSFIVKMAILVQYLKLFAPIRSVNRTMWYGAWGTIIACAIIYVVLLFWTAFYCNPRQAIWNKLTPGAKCYDVNDIILSQGAFNMGTDILILLLPTTSLWKLNVAVARKVAVTVLFGTGLLACIASAMRIVFTMKIARVISQSDVSHYGLFIGLWTEAEVALGFIVACSLSLPKLIQSKGPKSRRAMSVGSVNGEYPSFGSMNMNTGSISSSSYTGKDGRPVFFEDRELQSRQGKSKPDPYALPNNSTDSLDSMDSDLKASDLKASELHMPDLAPDEKPHDLKSPNPRASGLKPPGEEERFRWTALHVKNLVVGALHSPGLSPRRTSLHIQNVSAWALNSPTVSPRKKSLTVQNGSASALNSPMQSPIVQTTLTVQNPPPWATHSPLASPQRGSLHVQNGIASALTSPALTPRWGSLNSQDPNPNTLQAPSAQETQMRRLTPDMMSPEQLRLERDILQQFRFDEMMKKSMGDAAYRSRLGSHQQPQ